MDEAWNLEQELWRAAARGEVSAFYREHMTADAFMVVPNRLLHRHDLISWPQQQALPSSYQLSEPTMVLVDGESVLITYSVVVNDAGLIRDAGVVGDGGVVSGGDAMDYRAQVSALYTWSGGGWALAFRQHTPDTDASSPYWTG